MSIRLTVVQPRFEEASVHAVPVFHERVRAGFPSPAEPYQHDFLDLNDLIVRDQSATFYVRVEGDSMEEAGIFDGDYLVVDRSIEPKAEHIVVAAVDGQLTVKKLRFENGNPRRPVLWPCNSRHAPIRLTQDIDLHIWGVVTFALHPF
ncbi:MAG: translesion error-prone DNA polymerase V autoproteolytic subunit [Bacteroidota bacterium]